MGLCLSRLCASASISPKSRHASTRAASIPVAPAEIVIGCVAYCPEITAIWDGMKNYFLSSGVKFDYVLYTSYEAQVEALIRGHIDIAWNGPLAHVRLQNRTNNSSLSLGMRDVDRDCVAHVLARADSGIKTIADLTGRKLAVGSCDSPQSYILPFIHLQDKGVALNTLSVVRYDRDLGKHGDTAVGETEVLRALERGEAEAGFISDLMWSRAVNAGDVNTESKNRLIILPDGPPKFDHCQFDTLPTVSESKRTAFTKVCNHSVGFIFHEPSISGCVAQALFAMDWNVPEQRRVMQTEGLRKQWEGPRETGYENMRRVTSPILCSWHSTCVIYFCTRIRSMFEKCFDAPGCAGASRAAQRALSAAAARPARPVRAPVQVSHGGLGVGRCRNAARGVGARSAPRLLDAVPKQCRTGVSAGQPPLSSVPYASALW